MQTHEGRDNRFTQGFKRFTQRFVSRALLLAALSLSAPAHAVTIEYQASDLPNAVGDPDLWRYVYRVTATFAAFSGFNVLFDPKLYSQLQDPPPAPNAQWNVLTAPPDATLPADGLYTAIAQQASASLADAFTVDFVWLGAGAPAAQPFEVFDDSFNIIATGQTVAPGASAIPEPGSLLLLAGALGLLARRARR